MAIAIGVLIGFSVYTLGSYSAPPKARGSPRKPASIVDIKNNTIQQKKTLGSTSEITTMMNVYTNRDKPENYYSIQFPQNAIVEHGNNPSSYVARLPSGTVTFSVGLADIPDTSKRTALHAYSR